MIDQNSEHIKTSLAFPKLSTETLNGLYALGQSFYQQGRYKEASGYFQLLTLLDLANFKFWFALAAAQQLSKDYEKAIESYKVASQLDPNQPYVYKHTAECYIALGKIDLALETLNQAEIITKGKPQYKNLLADIVLIRSSWSKK